MKGETFLHILLLTLIMVSDLFSRFVVGSSSPPLLGIAPQDEKYYQASSDGIKCRDGSGKFSKAQLNDDFCDCLDGTDEPGICSILFVAVLAFELWLLHEDDGSLKGTSACPNGRFYCRNAGHIPLVLYSSRVNDGICDCCDGSDEYDGQVKCSNTCWEAGKAARDKLTKRISTFQEGVAMRKHEIERAKLAIAKDEKELSKLKNEERVLKGLVQRLKERKELIEIAEEKERSQKEKEEQDRKEAEQKATEEKSKSAKDIDPETKEHEVDEGGETKEDFDNDIVGLLDDPVGTAEGDGDAYSLPEIQEAAAVSSDVVHDADENAASDQANEQGDVPVKPEELSKEELGRLVASRWTGEKVDEEIKQDSSEETHKEDDKREDVLDEDLYEDDDDGYVSDSVDDNKKYEYRDPEDEIREDLFADDNGDSTSHHTNYSDSDSDDEPDWEDIIVEMIWSWLEKTMIMARRFLRAFNLFQRPFDKSEAASVRKEYDESSSKLSKIQSRISALSEKLKHDFGPEKVFYSFHGRCLESKQNKYVYKVCPYKEASQKEDYSTTRLGQWEKFDESYRVMVFSGGDRCWNGPDRSLKVKLRCSLTDELTDVDEPSRCEYMALLSTPAACTDDRLKELQDKLDAMNKNEPQSHDEL
ncbi:hypothetical protein MLD38_004254 [Melastoma candidum]|uniref:Uncharacterized protein n=1 Tax=Melastoma candidum TaxID=119954 RepID=A0ACB9S9S6_9MYRT|nr:hypothetical protein MLD38_004254 [Melastoma candidum]